MVDLKNIIQLLKLAIVLSTCFFMTACSLIFPKSTDQTIWTLNPNIGIVKHSKSYGHTILVLDTQAKAGLDTDEMAYVIKPNQLAYYQKNRWAAQPAMMLTPLIAQALRNTRHYKAVATAPIVAKVDYHLNTQLLGFQQVFLTKPSRFYIILAAQISRQSNDKIIASRVFSVSAPAPVNSPQGIAIAANRAAANLLRQLARFCAAVT